MNNEAFLTISLFVKISDVILQLLDPGELFLNTKVSNGEHCFLILDSDVNAAQTDIVFHVYWLVLVFNPVEALSPEHSCEHHHFVLALPAVDKKVVNATLNINPFGFDV